MFNLDLKTITSTAINRIKIKLLSKQTGEEKSCLRYTVLSLSGFNRIVEPESYQPF